MDIHIKIPVKAHIQKYLNSVYGEYFYLNKKDIIGNFLFFALRRQKNNKFLDKFLSKYTKTFTVVIPSNLAFGQGVRNVSSRTIVDFNNFVDSLIKEKLEILNHFKSDDLEINILIKNFMNFYNITEFDLSHEAFRKYLYRKKKQDSKACICNN